MENIHDWILQQAEPPALDFAKTRFRGFQPLNDRMYSVREAPVRFSSEKDMLRQLIPAQRLVYEKLDISKDIESDSDNKGAYGQQEHFHVGWKMSRQKLLDWKRIWTVGPNAKRAHANGLYFSKLDSKPEESIPSIKLDDTICMSRFQKRQSKILDDGTFTLCINMPYAYYSRIYTWDNFLCRWNGRLWATGTFEEEMDPVLEDVAVNGIKTPLVMKMDGGTIVSAKDCYGRLLYAMWLKLPMIPVVLYVKPGETDELESLVLKTGDKELANSFCKPEMIFL